MSEAIFANLPRFDDVGRSTPRRLTPVEIEAERAHKENAEIEAGFKRQITALESTLNSLADKIGQIETEARQQTTANIVSIAERLFPELSRRFLADEIAIHLEKLVPEGAVNVSIKAEPGVVARLEEVISRSNRLTAICHVEAQPGGGREVVDVSWKSGGLTFDFNTLLEACTARLKSLYAPMGEIS